MRKKAIILCLIIGAIVAYKYVYKSHRDIATEIASFKISASDLSEEFQINAKDSEAKYLDNTIQISGQISEVDGLSITLDDKVFCQFTEPQETSYKLNQEVKIKGRFIGYDDLLEQVKIDQCFIIN